MVVGQVLKGHLSPTHVPWIRAPSSGPLTVRRARNTVLLQQQEEQASVSLRSSEPVAMVWICKVHVMKHRVRI